MLQLLLPLLNPYLLEDIQTAGLDADTGLARRLAKQGRTQDAVGYDDLRLRIVRLLGRLGGNNRFIVATVDQSLKKALAWSDASENPVKFEGQFDLLARSGGV